jgi:hypothetical protein
VNTRPPCKDFIRSLYFRGPLALQNLAYLDFELPFSYNEGVFYRCDIFDYHVFYITDTISRKGIIEKTISNIIEKRPELTPVKESNGFFIKENEHLRYSLLPENNVLVIIRYN